jgi:hypothetical protein
MVVGIGLGTIMVSCADRAPATKPIDAGMTAATNGNPEPGDLEFDGTIERIDADNGSITVQHWPLSKRFRVPPDCEIDISTNANVTLAQLKVFGSRQGVRRQPDCATREGVQRRAAGEDGAS